ncbi:MAG: protein-L-isoaspartate(D-aspartate) O-methyltransferase [Neoaquamicrobium sediminum]|uniref:protein-L-isoaspartate(D-aspartate) O-methyltransferase n=1 Tax=Neoaquamicrobium sediminum TaxID=1849104 RepID=UPI0040372521
MAPDFAEARRRMIQTQLIRRGIEDNAVLRAMGTVGREHFVPTSQRALAYEDTALPIGEEQTISQPFIVALMIEAAEVEPGAKVLEVGVGSGYAAAVLGSIASRVIAIDRHQTLVEVARKNLAGANISNVEVCLGDGTRGKPEDAPFDAIIVSAGGPDIPHALVEQLEIGGRLIVPVGELGAQRLLRVVRLGAGRYEEEDLGNVMFVPLVGEQGWPDQAEARRGKRSDARDSTLESIAETLQPIDAEGFAVPFDRFGDRRVILLGESTHGTSEFYRARAAITRRLIERHGFTALAVEADWPDAAAINRVLRGIEPLPAEEPPFSRFPQWMWRNKEMAAFLSWLGDHNRSRREREAQTGFYGLDLYNVTGAIASVLAHLDRVDPHAASIARERYGCMTPWQHDPAAYARAAVTAGYRSCEEEVVAQCRELLTRRMAFAAGDGESFLDAAQSARLVASAEQYYRTMYYGGTESWNLRDGHMFETLRGILAQDGHRKVVVWAHNSHVGDARETEMGRARNQLSLGQLCREHFGQEVALIGFGTHEGTVAAANGWDEPVQRISMRPSAQDSWERLCHQAAPACGLIDFTSSNTVAEQLAKVMPQRFVGVIYRPHTERQSHYLDASAPGQYDAYVWLDKTTALEPLDERAQAGEPADTFPSGM